jgi:hypothetical protein
MSVSPVYFGRCAKIAKTMKRPSTLWATALLLAGTAVGTVGCHYDRDTAGRPDAEKGDGLDGSVTATKEGTGDPKVGSGRGQVGTDAPARPSDAQPPNSSPNAAEGKPAQ